MRLILVSSSPRFDCARTAAAAPAPAAPTLSLRSPIRHLERKHAFAVVHTVTELKDQLSKAIACKDDKSIVVHFACALSEDGKYLLLQRADDEPPFPDALASNDVGALFAGFRETNKQLLLVFDAPDSYFHLAHKLKGLVPAGVAILSLPTLVADKREALAARDCRFWPMFYTELSEREQWPSSAADWLALVADTKGCVDGVPLEVVGRLEVCVNDNLDSKDLAATDQKRAIDASSSLSLTQHEPNVLAVLLVTGVSDTEMDRLVGCWERERVTAMGLFDARSKLKYVVLGTHRSVIDRGIRSVLVVHIVNGLSENEMRTVAGRVQGLAGRVAADVIGAVNLTVCETDRLVAFDHKQWWNGLNWDFRDYGYPVHLDEPNMDTYDVKIDAASDSLPQWVGDFFYKWPSLLFHVALKNSEIDTRHAVDALTHCMMSLDNVQLKKRQYCVSVHMVDDFEKSAQFLPFVTTKISGALHVKPAAGSTHFLFSKVSQGEFQRAQLQFMMQRSEGQGVGFDTLPPGTKLCVLDDDDKRFENNAESQVAARFKASLPQRSERSPRAALTRALFDQGFTLEIAAAGGGSSSGDDAVAEWTWWCGFVKRYLEQRSTFDKPTPLTKGGFVELQLFEFSEEQLKAAASLSAVMLHADGDSSAQRADNPALSLIDAAKELQTHRVIALFGEAGQGKTSTLRQWQQLLADSDELALCVRADELWQSWAMRSSHSTDAFLDALVDAFAASVGKFDDMIETERASVGEIDDSTGRVMNEKERASVRALAQERGVALLLDSIDEVPPAERASPAFKSWLEWLVKGVAVAAASDEASRGEQRAAQTTRPLLTRVVLASRYSAQATLLSLRNVRGGGEKMKACCIAPMSDDIERQYVSALLATWESRANADEVLELSRTILRTPLMLLMLCVLIDGDKLSASTSNRPSLYDTYEALLELLYERERRKRNSLLADVDRREWLFDLYALLGFLCHYVGGATGSALVRKFDVALLFETFRAEGQLLAEDDKFIESIQGHRLTDEDDVKVPEIKLVSWLIETLGMVSASPGEQALVQRVVFGHRTFQEFLTARALVRSVEKAELNDGKQPKLGQIVVLSGFDWQGGATVANQWWDQVLMFVASKRGLEFVIQKVANESVSRTSGSGAVVSDKKPERLMANETEIVINEENEELSASVVESVVGASSTRAVVDANSSANNNTFKPDSLVGVVVLSGVPTDMLMLLAGTWVGVRVKAALINFKNVDFLILQSKRRDYNNVTLVVQGTIGPLESKQQLTLSGIAEELQADILGVIDIHTEQEVSGYALRPPLALSGDWNCSRYGYPKILVALYSDEDNEPSYPLVNKALQDVRWEKLFNDWPDDAQFVARMDIAEPTTKLNHSVDALTHCLMALDGHQVDVNRKYTVSFSVAFKKADGLKFMPMAIEIVDGVPHLKPRGGSTQFIFTEVPRHEFQRVKLQLLMDKCGENSAQLLGQPGLQDAEIDILDPEDPKQKEEYQKKVGGNPKSLVAARFKSTSNASTNTPTAREELQSIFDTSFVLTLPTLSHRAALSLTAEARASPVGRALEPHFAADCNLFVALVDDATAVCASYARAFVIDKIAGERLVLRAVNNDNSTSSANQVRSLVPPFPSEGTSDDQVAVLAEALAFNVLALFDYDRALRIGEPPRPWPACANVPVSVAPSADVGDAFPLRVDADGVARCRLRVDNRTGLARSLTVVPLLFAADGSVALCGGSMTVERALAVDLELALHTQLQRAGAVVSASEGRVVLRVYVTELELGAVDLHCLEQAGFLAPPTDRTVDMGARERRYEQIPDKWAVWDFAIDVMRPATDVSSIDELRTLCAARVSPITVSSPQLLDFLLAPPDAALVADIVAAYDIDEARSQLTLKAGDAGGGENASSLTVVGSPSDLFGVPAAPSDPPMINLSSIRLLPNSERSWIELVNDSLSRRRTLDMPTPLGDSGFIELHVFEYGEKEIRQAAAQSITTIHADFDETSNRKGLETKKVADVLKNHHALLLFGEAGQGKTSLMLQWQQLLAGDKFGELAVCVRADDLWQRCKSVDSLDIDSFVDALVDVYRVVNDEGKLRQLEDTEKQNLRELVFKHGVSLLLDSIDEVPPAERASPAFKNWLDWLTIKNVVEANVRSQSDSDKRPLLRRIVLASRYSALDTLVPLLNSHTDVRACCIAPMSDANERGYVEKLFKTWSNLPADDPSKYERKKGDVEQVVEFAHSVGVHRTPLMLLMLCVLYFGGKLSLDNASLYNTYESLLELLFERELAKPNSPLHDVDRNWLFDMYALLGFLCHYVGSVSGSAMVRKFDVAVLFEVFQAEGQLLDDKHAKFLASLNVNLPDADAKVNEIKLLSWLINTFGLVSASFDEQTLSQRIVFGHRTFQEFLAARALVRCAELKDSGAQSWPRLDQIVVLKDFDWKSGATLANQWWDQVMMFVASGQGLLKLFKSISDEDDNGDLYHWENRLIEADGVDRRDLGHVRLVLLLRAALASDSSKNIYHDKKVLQVVSYVLQVIARQSNPTCAQLISNVPNPTLLMVRLMKVNEGAWLRIRGTTWSNDLKKIIDAASEMIGVGRNVAKQEFKIESTTHQANEKASAMPLEKAVRDSDSDSRETSALNEKASVMPLEEAVRDSDPDSRETSALNEIGEPVVEKKIDTPSDEASNPKRPAETETTEIQRDEQHDLVAKLLRLCDGNDDELADDLLKVDDAELARALSDENGSKDLRVKLQDVSFWSKFLFKKSWQQKSTLVDQLCDCLRSGNKDAWVAALKNIDVVYLHQNEHGLWRVSRDVRCLLPDLSITANPTDEERLHRFHSRTVLGQNLHFIAKPSIWVDRPELSDLKKLVEDGKRMFCIVLYSDDGIPGGQGKTTLARKLASELRQSFVGPHIELDMKTGLADMNDVTAHQLFILDVCGLPLDDEKKRNDPKYVRAAYSALFSKVRDGVLLFDDVQKDNDKLLVDELLPPKESGWLVIVTTRRGDLMSLKPIAEEHGVGRLSTDAGVELLMKHAYGKNSKRAALVDGDEKVLEDIVEACGHIALAIELAGSRLNKKPSLKLTRLHEQLIAKGAHKLDAMNASLHVPYDDLSDDEKHALWQASAFPTSFPQFVFDKAMEDESKKDDDNNADDDDFWVGFGLGSSSRSLLDQLVSLSLVQRLSDNRFVVHDVVREFARKQADKEQLAKCVELAGLAYADLIDEIEKQYKQFGGQKEAIDRMRVEFNALEHFMEFGSFDVRKAIAVVGSKSSCFYYAFPHSIQFEFLEKIYNEMLEKSECIQSDQAMVESGFLNLKNRLARLLKDKGEYEKSMAMFEEMIKVEERVLGGKHPNTLTSKHNLASALDSMGKHNEAMEMFKEVLAVQERVLGLEHPDTLTSKHSLASVLKNMGKYNEAIEMYKEVLAVRERVLGVEHPDTLTSKNNLATALASAERFDEAIHLLERDVIPGLTRVLGPNHPDTINAKKKSFEYQAGPKPTS